MNPSGTSAIYGQARYKVAIPDEVSAVREDNNAKTVAVKQENNDTANLASLVTHPGWMLLEAKMQQRIAAFKSGSYLVDEVAKHVKSEELGDILKVEMKVAAQLESFIRDVHTAFTTIEADKEQRRASVRRTGA